MLDISDSPLQARLAELRRLYQTSFGGKALQNHLLFNRYNLTPSYLMPLFLAGLGERTRPQKSSGIRLRLNQALLLLVSLYALSKLLLFCPRVILYSIDKVSSPDHDHDQRMDEVYKELKEEKIFFMELLHTSISDEFLPNLMRRRRAAFYIEAVDIAFSLLRALRLAPRTLVPPPDTPVSEKGGALARAHFYHLDRAAFRVHFFRMLFRLARTRVSMSIDDTRIPELVIAAHESGVPALQFQHGHYTKYHVGYLKSDGLLGEYVYPDRLYVWSEYWREELRRLGTYIPEDHLRIGGAKDIPHRSFPSEGGKRTLLIPYETVAPKEEVSAYLRAVEEHPGWRILFKIRKDMPRAVQLREYGMSESANCRVIDDLASWKERVSVVAGTYSTFLYDLIAARVPVVLFATSSDYGEGMARNGLADLATRDNLFTVLEKAAACSGEERERRAAQLYGAHPVQLADTLRSVIKEFTLRSS